MTTDDAVRWAESRACRACRKSDSPDHDACNKAKDAAELIRRLAEQVQ